MNTLAITAPNMEHRLREKLGPTALQVLDESHAHDGHAGANGTGFGTHFRVRITYWFAPRTPASPCV